jgi:hypothetical protein
MQGKVLANPCVFDARLTYMKPAPPVINMFLAFANGSNLVLPVSTGACRHMSSFTYVLGFRIVDRRRPKHWSVLCRACTQCRMYPRFTPRVPLTMVSVAG